MLIRPALNPQLAANGAGAAAAPATRQPHRNRLRASDSSSNNNNNSSLRGRESPLRGTVPRSETGAASSGRSSSSPRHARGPSVLFETLARSPTVWTIGGESHQVIEGVPGLAPRQPRLGLEPADPNRRHPAGRRAPARGLPRPASRPRRQSARRGRERPADAREDAEELAAGAIPGRGLAAGAVRLPLSRPARVAELDDHRVGVGEVRHLSAASGLAGPAVVAGADARVAQAEGQAAGRDRRRPVGEGDRDPAPRPRACRGRAGLRGRLRELRRRPEGGGGPDLRVRRDRVRPGPRRGLPLSRHTVDPPEEGKWRRHEELLEPVLPQVTELAERARKWLTEPPPPRQQQGGGQAGGRLRSVNTSNFPRDPRPARELADRDHLPERAG